MINERNRHQRLIIERIIVRGTLVLDTPTCLGNGDADGPTDLMLLRDSISSHALLTGASIAGALRNYLRERKYGYGGSELAGDLVTYLFGGMRSDDDGNQSPLIIDDAISSKPIQAELRDGVKIDSLTRTATDKAKYDLELMQAGTEFPLCFELLIDKKEEDQTKQKVYEAELLKGLAIALSGLEPKNGSKSGEICLGMKKRRGFGRCHVKEWQVWNFNLEDLSDRMAWLTLDHSWSTDPPCTKSPVVDASIVAALKKVGFQVGEDWEDKRDRFTIQATFKLASPLLIRSVQFEAIRAPDVVHLKSKRNGKLEPVLSGTSLAGVLRHRAERIVNTLGKDPNLVNQVFGFVHQKSENAELDSVSNKQLKAKASRLVVHESIINGITEQNELVQTRIAIDRFTGGAYQGALFQEQPIFSNGEENLRLEIELRQPENYEIGLLLLLLKDLWTEDLPVGGASSIGRGRLEGRQANLTLHKSQKQHSWTIIQSGKDQPVQVSEPEKLEEFVQAIVDYPKQEIKKDE